MEYEIETDNITQQRWHEYARHFADYSIYQTFEYQQIRADDDGQLLKRVIVKRNDKVILMSHVRIKQIHSIRLKIGYVQFGPLWINDSPLYVVAEALQRFRTAMFDLGINILRVVPNVINNDFGGNFKRILHQSGFELVPGTRPYHTMMISLAEDEQTIFGKIKKDTRRMIRNAQKQPIEVKQETGVDFFKVLESIYLKSKTRKHFDGIDSSQFLRTQERLPEDQKSQILLAYIDNEPASGLVTSHFGNTAVPIILANNELGCKYSCSYLLFWLAFTNAKKAGMEFYDMGGVDEIQNPNGYLFKKKFGGDELSYIGAFEASSNHVLSSGLHFVEKSYRLIRKV